MDDRKASGMAITITRAVLGDIESSASDDVRRVTFGYRGRI